MTFAVGFLLITDDKTLVKPSSILMMFCKQKSEIASTHIYKLVYVQQHIKLAIYPKNDMTDDLHRHNHKYAASGYRVQMKYGVFCVVQDSLWRKNVNSKFDCFLNNISKKFSLVLWTNTARIMSFVRKITSRRECDNF